MPDAHTPAQSKGEASFHTPRPSVANKSQLRRFDRRHAFFIATIMPNGIDFGVGPNLKGHNHVP